MHPAASRTRQTYCTPPATTPRKAQTRGAIILFVGLALMVVAGDGPWHLLIGDTPTKTSMAMLVVRGVLAIGIYGAMLVSGMVWSRLLRKQIEAEILAEAEQHLSD